MELPRPLWLFLGLILAVNAAPVHYITLPASTYPLIPQGNPFYYLSSPLSRTAANPQGSETSLKYVALSHPEASPDQRYVIAPYSSYQGFLPYGRTRVAGLGPQGYINNEYLVYPDTATGRQGFLQNFANFVSQQFQNLQIPAIFRPRPENPQESEGPDNSQGGAPLPPFSEGISGQNPAPGETEDLDTVNPDENPAPPASNAESAENPSAPAAAEEVAPQSPMEEATAEMGSESRLFARSRAYPVRDGEGEMEEEVGEQEEEEEEDKEEEEEKEEDDSVVIGPGSANPSIAQAKPAAIALAGMGGVAAAAPTATAVVGANGLAVSAPSATAVAGPSAGSAPSGLFPKGTKVKRVKVTPEEARINAAKIQAARQSAYDAITGMRMAGLQSFPFFGYRF